jgi:hypothetical protein
MKFSTNSLVILLCDLGVFCGENSNITTAKSTIRISSLEKNMAILEN